MIKGIFFDFYGTIGIYNDIEVADKQTWNIIYEFISKETNINYDDFLKKWSEIFGRSLSINEIEHESIFIEKLSAIFKYYNISISKKDLLMVGEKCLNFWHSHINIPINLHNTLCELKKDFKLAIVSNYDHPTFLKSIIESNGLEKYFDYIIISGEIGICKPDKRIFEKALNNLELRADEVIFIGDSLKDDIQGAINVGCYPILIDAEDKYKEYKGVKINKLYDLLNINLNLIENQNDKK